MGTAEGGQEYNAVEWSAGRIKKVTPEGGEGQSPKAHYRNFLVCSGNSKEATVAGTDKAEKVEDEIREITGVRF